VREREKGRENEEEGIISYWHEGEKFLLRKIADTGNRRLWRPLRITTNLP